jgi:hypothetical protein
MVKLPLAGDTQKLCQARIDAITEAEYRSLWRFADDRLTCIGLPPTDALDMVNQAIYLVEQGMLNGDGRKPTRKDVVSEKAFHDYMTGTINSLINAESRKRKHRGTLTDAEWENLQGKSELACEQACRNDIKAQLFVKLRQEAAPHLHPTIDAYEQIFDHCDRIPTVNGKRKYAHEVRRMARKIVSGCFSEFRGVV